MAEPNRTRARELAEESLAAGDPTGWFDRLYLEQEQGALVVPWADRGASPNLLEFYERSPFAAGRGLVVGCGFGDDAEQLAAWGFETTAFDISPAAIRACKQRFPGSRVNYVAADVFAPPDDWSGRFDLVLESNTLQALPKEIRARAIRSIGRFVKKAGAILVIARAREENEPEGQMPWPLTRVDMDEFVAAGLTQESFEDFWDRETPPVRRFRAVYRAPFQPVA